MKVKFLLLTGLMCISLTACNQATTSDENGGLSDEEIENILDRAHERSNNKQKIDIQVEDCKYFCD